jgi:pimeloyl-ACP methyl ester carboxylesterase
MAAEHRNPHFCCRIALAAYWVLLAGLGHCGANALPALPRPGLAMGSVELTPCPDSLAYCGSLDRPLDPTGVVPGHIAIHFEYYPHSAAGASAGTLVATEGGPGYPATLSRDDYLTLFRPLRRHRDVLLMDNRGTGQSAAIDCHGLQIAEKWTIERVADCGRSLGNRASLYGTAYAADDLAAILAALGVTRIDLYGDSYGTSFEQVFAQRHPTLLRSLVLDGAYPLGGPDYAWYPSYAPAMREKFNLLCRRFRPCANLPGSSIDHVQPGLQELRAHPFVARAADSDGKLEDFTADASQLAIVMFGSAPAIATARELDAAARAFSDGDRAPLLRLMAETKSAVDSRDPSADPTKWSAGLAVAVMCQDWPQIFDMRLPPSLRAADRDRAIAEHERRQPGTYAPFTIDEYRGMPLDYSYLDQCVAWPAIYADHPAPPAGAADAAYRDVPALILSGEFDDITTPADATAVAATFKRGTQIRFANSFHVNALPRSRSTCGAQIVRRFIDTLQPGDLSCAAKIPPLRLVPRFARHAAQLEPAVAAAGYRATTAQLQWMSAAAQTAGDVLARVGGNTLGAGVGLRGGSFHVADDGSTLHLTLTQVRWVEDVSVSGSIDAPASRTGTVHASLQVTVAGGTTGELVIEWPDSGAEATAAILGTLGGLAMSARAAAP